MTDSALLELGTVDDAGRPLFRIAASTGGELVLRNPGAPLGRGLRELEVDERIRLAALSLDRPALVVEDGDGHYVVLVDQAVDLDRHVPLGPADAEMLATSAARASFGRRDDDVLTLTPWADDDEIQAFDPGSPDFEQVPLVSVETDGELTWHRGGLPDDLVSTVRKELARMGAEPGVRFGVLTNPFGECACVPEGAPLMPHEDVRRQALVNTESLLESVETLALAARRLRAVADRFEAADRAQWQLSHPVTDGIAYAEPAPTQ